ncbi:hypothetical protein TWF506_007398 [Arthrobotrys conoides]|uniref:Uncharacterized protein n=1 Tax=Arthrobotrys conoides TaxID=74498 RepID=A0AAN8N776_9PEZI
MLSPIGLAEARVQFLDPTVTDAIFTYVDSTETVTIGTCYSFNYTLPMCDKIDWGRSTVSDQSQFTSDAQSSIQQNSSTSGSDLSSFQSRSSRSSASGDSESISTSTNSLLPTTTFLSPSSSSVISSATESTTTIAAIPGPSFVFQGSGEYLGFYSTFDVKTGAVVLLKPGDAAPVSLQIDSNGELRSSVDLALLAFLRETSDPTLGDGIIKRQTSGPSSARCQVCQLLYGIDANITVSDITEEFFLENDEPKLGYGGNVYDFYVVEVRTQLFLFMISDSVDIALVPESLGFDVKRMAMIADNVASVSTILTGSLSSTLTSSSILPSLTSSSIPSPSSASSGSESSIPSTTSDTPSSSSVIYDAYQIIISYSYESYCSALLQSTTTESDTTTFADPTITTSTTTTDTVISSVFVPVITSSSATSTTLSATSVTNTVADNVRHKYRQIETPQYLITFPPDQITSACSRAVVPDTKIISEISTSTVPITTEVQIVSEETTTTSAGSTSVVGYAAAVDYGGIGAIRPVDSRYPGMLMRSYRYCAAWNCGPYSPGTLLVACPRSNGNRPVVNWYINFDQTMQSWYIQVTISNNNYPWAIPVTKNIATNTTFRISTNNPYSSFTRGVGSGNQIFYINYNLTDPDHYMYPNTELIGNGNLWTCVFYPDAGTAVIGVKTGMRTLFFVPTTFSDAAFSALMEDCNKVPDNKLQLVYYSDPNTRLKRVEKTLEP